MRREDKEMKVETRAYPGLMEGRFPWKKLTKPDDAFFVSPKNGETINGLRTSIHHSARHRGFAVVTRTGRKRRWKGIWVWKKQAR